MKIKLDPPATLRLCKNDWRRDESIEKVIEFDILVKISILEIPEPSVIVVRTP